MDPEALVKEALEEDIGDGDLTTRFIVDNELTGTARVISRSEGVLSGCMPFIQVFLHLDESVKLKPYFQDGRTISEGDVICELRGSVSAILTGERTALNFLGRLSGIATLTRCYVDRVRGTKAVILDTRKTTPLWRSLEKAAVRHGGGENHRHGLYDMILIKDNHETAAGGIAAALSLVTAGLQESGRDIPVEIEVQNPDQIEEVMDFQVSRILLDNFDMKMIAKAVSIVSGCIPLEVSGGVTLENVHRIAATGVDYISVGALTHSASCLDFTLLLDE